MGVWLYHFIYTLYCIYPQYIILSFLGPDSRLYQPPEVCKETLTYVTFKIIRWRSVIMTIRLFSNFYIVWICRLFAAYVQLPSPVFFFPCDTNKKPIDTFYGTGRNALRVQIIQSDARFRLQHYKNISGDFDFVELSNIQQPPVNMFIKLSLSIFFLNSRSQFVFH